MRRHEDADPTVMLHDLILSSRETPSRRDVLLGAGLVAAFAVVIAATAWAFDASGGAVTPALLVAGGVLVVDAALWLLPWRRLGSVWLVAFPVTLSVGLVVLSLTTHGVAQNYIGFFALAFIYLGLTQNFVVVGAFTVVAIPSFLLAEESLSTQTVVRLITITTIWLLMGWVFASRSERDRAQGRDLIARANTDFLTGMASRLLLSDHIDRVLGSRAAATSALMVLDLDGFKNVNDTFGHAAGDELLIAVAGRIRASVRPGDTCARLGGDEFAVLLRDVDRDEAGRTATRLIAALAEPFALSRGRIAVTASIGVAELAGSETAQSAMRDADLAMYEAKAAGRNQSYVFEYDMHQRRTARMQLETELRDGFERKEFELHYQPVVHLRTGSIIGTEALLRWNHPTRGLLTPDQFLSTSEEIGIIVALGDWILHEALRQAASWQPQNPSLALTMAVNVSGPEMLASDYVAQVRDALEANGIPGELLVLEITERQLVTDAQLLHKRIEALRKLGVRIAIDDFGTGYSSLAYLREFPVDILKVDQSFIRPLGLEPQAVALLRSILAIADALKLDVIVEGVETPTQVEILTGLGCEVAQGYHFARPGPAGIVAEQLRDAERETFHPSDTGQYGRTSSEIAGAPPWPPPPE
jgi:diguanylate cyclase (GGDEF)-like protein